LRADGAVGSHAPPGALRAGARVAAVPPTAAAAQTGADAPTTGSTEIATFTGGVALPLRTDIMVTAGSRPFDVSGVEIKGVDSVIFAAESGEHRLLTGVYYISALRNSIISLGQLDENGSRVEIKDGVMRIWDRHRRLLTKVTRGTN
jgi:hypothetical protein